MKHDHQRGEIRDNAIKALVTSPLFKAKVEKSKKGKGSYTRKAKHKGKEPISKMINTIFLAIGFFIVKKVKLCSQTKSVLILPKIRLHYY